jgi:hypothetical protein
MGIGIDFMGIRDNISYRAVLIFFKERAHLPLEVSFC